MRNEDFNLNWDFLPFDVRQKKGPFPWKKVNLPHASKTLPLDYFDESEYQFVATYRKRIPVSSIEEGDSFLLTFDGFSLKLELEVNGKAVGSSLDGFTGYRIDIKDYLRVGQNEILVFIDSREDKKIPPFGGVVDYLTYGGCTREAHFEKIQGNYVEKACLFYQEDGSLRIRLQPHQKGFGHFSFSIDGPFFTKRWRIEENPEDDYLVSDCAGIRLWSVEEPNLYHLEFKIGENTKKIEYGFRHISLLANQLCLNGKPLKLRGLNRHDSFPYVGFAGTRNMHYLDAKLLKEYGINVVRMSHYPQSEDFIEACDKLGILLIEETPGWQFVGDEAWQKTALHFLEKMIDRDINHPSIFMWGVRINESVDQPSFYRQSNALAKQRDPLRLTGGVRCIKNSELLEDVYTYNDFSYSPDKPLEETRNVTGLSRDVPYLISEFGGHIYPTKKTDDEERLANQALMHARIQSAAQTSPKIIGAIGWCAFDYGTHHQFGSGDKICHHGVFDIFRQPKFAAFFYLTQRPFEEKPVLKVATYWAFGDRNYGGVCPLYVFSNCERISYQIQSHDEVFVEKDPSLPNNVFVIKGMGGAWGAEWKDVVFRGYWKGKVALRETFLASQTPFSLTMEPSDSEIKNNDAVYIHVGLLDKEGHLLHFSSDVLDIRVTGARLIGPAHVSLSGGEYAFYVRAKRKGLAKIRIACRGFANEKELEIL